MGIVISKNNFSELNEKASKRFDKKTADAIVHQLCRALATDERWVKLSPADALAMAKENNITLPNGNFKPMEVGKLSMKREKNINYVFYRSVNGVVKGWHSATIAGLIEAGIKTEEPVTGFVFEMGQKIIKTNNVRYKTNFFFSIKE